MSFTLEEKGADVTVLTESTPNRYNDTICDREPEIIDLNSLSSLSNFLKNFDVLHFQVGNSKYHLFQLDLISRVESKKIPVVTTLHDSTLRTLFYHIISNKKLWRKYSDIFIDLMREYGIQFLKFAEEFFLKASDLTLVHSKANKEFLSSKYPEKDYKIIRHIGYFDDFMREREDGNKYNSDYFLLYSSAYKYSNLESIFKTFIKKYPSQKISLLVLGASLQDLISDYGFVKNRLGNDIFILKRVSEDSYITLFNNASAVIFPSEFGFHDTPYENRYGSLKPLLSFLGFSNPPIRTSGALIHALSAGTPVIGPNETSFKEYIPSNGCYLIEVENYVNLSRAMKNSISDRERTDYSDSNILKEIHPNSVGKKHLSAYKKAISNF
ncbi:hypothetical protein AKJ55_01445 [candidate division MSBL1 archaeon SCGC-AAA382M17]|uniref:Glycosyltransferase subfamily 4-like N-terminal domain-containing protein n=1 Tax=candidate division MSBL1 archaeon SCGC-AAA382M17 TaxID=1698284 RepID=A0ABR5TJJ5_9EURY|nr:hypothetical protein AKJ55_01445 [candidate division MSBL1 archaeon SCGC-AAA382M17]